MKIPAYLAAFGLIGIAVNLTVSTALQMKQTGIGQPQPAETIVQVIGKSSEWFGNGSGFVLRDGQRLEVSPIQKGSMADMSGYQPAYMVRKVIDGKVQYLPIKVDTYPINTAEPASARPSNNR